MKCHVIIGHHSAYCTIGIESYDMYKLQKLRLVSESTQANNSFCFSQELGLYLVVNYVQFDQTLCCQLMQWAHFLL